MCHIAYGYLGFVSPCGKFWWKSQCCYGSVCKVVSCRTFAVRHLLTLKLPCSVGELGKTTLTQGIKYYPWGFISSLALMWFYISTVSIVVCHLQSVCLFYHSMVRKMTKETHPERILRPRWWHTGPILKIFATTILSNSSHPPSPQGYDVYATTASRTLIPSLSKLFHVNWRLHRRCQLLYIVIWTVIRHVLY